MPIIVAACVPAAVPERGFAPSGGSNARACPRIGGRCGIASIELEAQPAPRASRSAASRCRSRWALALAFSASPGWSSRRREPACSSRAAPASTPSACASPSISSSSTRGGGRLRPGGRCRPAGSPRGAARPPCSSCRHPQGAGTSPPPGESRVGRRLGRRRCFPRGKRSHRSSSARTTPRPSICSATTSPPTASERSRLPSASDALRLCRYNHPDLLLLDLALPDASGLDVLREIREADGVDARFDPKLPVIVLSGRGADAERVRGLEFGADDYLVKPNESGSPALESGIRSSRGARSLSWSLQAA